MSCDILEAFHFDVADEAAGEYNPTEFSTHTYPQILLAVLKLLLIVSRSQLQIHLLPLDDTQKF
jgi:hypothetical protein